MAEFPAEFEEAFQRAYKMPVQPSAAPKCPWSGQFLQSRASRMPDWAQEYKHQQTGQGQSKWSQEYIAGAGGNWAEEFAQSATASTEWSREFNQVNTWIEEYKSAPVAQDTVTEVTAEEQEKMAGVARELLNSLDLSEPKLARSKFVAYLQELSGPAASPAFCPFNPHATGHADFAQWRAQYLENVSHLADEESKEWQSMEKGWERYEATGLGYDRFAQAHYSRYIFSIPAGLNPHHTATDKMGVALGFEAAKDLRNAILAYEALVHEDPTCKEAWLRLGLLQQQNEMDSQAIAALFQADQRDPAVLIPLAASLVNESCIPEALDALQRCLVLWTGRQLDAELKGPTLLASLLREMSLVQGELGPSAQLNGQIALSILFSIAGNHAQAIEVLRGALARDPANAELLNRLGAVLANHQDYGGAMEAYDAALRQHPAFVRAHFNRGISQMCGLKDHLGAARSFIKALQLQLPVDVVEQGSGSVVEAACLSIWDTLRSNLEMMPEGEVRDRLLERCQSRDIPGLVGALMP
jgi:tetratricopeptide (TPR) repeat protein